MKTRRESRKPLLLLTLVLELLVLSWPGYCAPLLPPTEFTRQVVNQLLDEVDKPRNATYLKVLYFSSRSPSPLPVDQGWELLEQHLESEKPGSKRWFILQDIRGFAAFRISSVDKSVGFQSYRAIFERANSASSSEADYYLQQSLAEFINSIPISFNPAIRQNKEMLPTIAEAWQAFVVERQEKRVPYLSPHWHEAFDAVGVPIALPELVEKQLNDKETPRTFEFLAGAAEILSYTQGERAVEVWKEAKNFNPVDENGALDTKALSFVYDQLFSQLRALNRPGEAKQVVLERIARLGRGRADLLRVARDVKDQKAVEEILRELSVPGAPEDEVLDVSAELYSHGYDPARDMIWDKTSLQHAMRLLIPYLSSRRNRDIRIEMRARLLLSSIYEITNQKSKAIAALKYTLPSGQDEDVASLFQALQSQRASLEQLASSQ